MLQCLPISSSPNPIAYIATEAQLQAITAVTAAPVPMTVISSFALTGAQTVPAGFSLTTIPGAVITTDSASGKTLTYAAGSYGPGLDVHHQCFAGDGVISESYNWTEVHPELWGVDGTVDQVEFQYAQDCIDGVSGAVELLPGKTYVCTVPNSATIVGTVHYGIWLSSNVTWRGYPTTTVKLADGQAASGPFGIWASNTSIENITFQGFVVDLNGDNNPLAGTLDATTAIYIGGVNGKIQHFKSLGMTYRECPGANVLILGSSWSTALSDDLIVSKNRFYNVATDASSSDHSSVYTYADNVRIENNLFENDWSVVEGKSQINSWEFHGSNNIAVGNTVKNYTRGCYLCANLISPVYKQIVVGNTFLTTRQGPTLWASVTSGASTVSDIVIANNIIEGIDGGAHTFVGVNLNTTKNVSNALIADNIIRYTSALGSANVYGIYLVPGSSTDYDGMQIFNNLVSGFVSNMYISSIAGTFGSVDVKGNTFKNAQKYGANPTYGIYIAGAETKDNIVIQGNTFIDNQDTPVTDYGVYAASGNATSLLDISNNVFTTMTTGVYLSGTVTSLLAEGNKHYNNTINFSNGATYTSAKINGRWTLKVAAAATGGTDTFIVTITFPSGYSRFAILADLVGYFGVTENIYKQFCFNGYLNSNTLLEKASGEIISQGNALKTQLTAADPVAVGSNYQISITFTNADDAAFSGQMRLSSTDIGSDVIKTVTVANNQ